MKGFFASTYAIFSFKRRDIVFAITGSRKDCGASFLLNETIERYSQVLLLACVF